MVFQDKFYLLPSLRGNTVGGNISLPKFVKHAEKHFMPRLLRPNEHHPHHHKEKKSLEEHMSHLQVYKKKKDVGMEKKVEKKTKGTGMFFPGRSASEQGGVGLTHHHKKDSVAPHHRKSINFSTDDFLRHSS